MTSTRINAIGYASGIAANDTGCANGPIKLKQAKAYKQVSKEKLLFEWHALLKPLANKRNDITALAELNKRLAKYTQKLVCDQLRFLVMGGDHTSAIGTWSGAQTAIQPHGKFGLIWIDAHLDSHTPETTQTGNIHGMPLACLLGFGPTALTSICHTEPKLLPANVCIIGVRSFEASEAKFLADLGIPIYFMDDIKQRGLAAILAEARELVTKNTVGYGLSIDLDAFDPQDAPGVGVAEPDGIMAQELLANLTLFTHDRHLLGVELAEYNPHHDIEQRTAKLCCEIIDKLFDQRGA